MSAGPAAVTGPASGPVSPGAAEKPPQSPSQWVLVRRRFFRHKLAVTGVLVAIGHQPTDVLFKGVLDLHENGYLKVKPGTAHTIIDGVFACGDVADS